MGFEDVDMHKMIIEMLLALPCFIASLLTWFFILRKTNNEKIVKQKVVLKETLNEIKPTNIKENIKSLMSRLCLWKWGVFLGTTVLYIVVNLIRQTPISFTAINVFLFFTAVMVLFKIFNLNDLENFLLICATGLIGSRHGIFFRGYNLYYPIGTYCIACIVFFPGEIRAFFKERSNAIKKNGKTVGHDRVAYYFSTGYLIMSVLYFLTGF